MKKGNWYRPLKLKGCPDTERRPGLPLLLLLVVVVEATLFS
jgi:hypothetical protein